MRLPDRQPAHRRDERGVTLLELLVAMTLLAVALIGLAASFPLSMFGVTLGGYQTTATLLAQQSLEDARGRAYSNLTTVATGGSVCTTSGGGTFVSVTGYSGFSRCVSVETGVPIAGTSTVTVVVRFQLGDGQPLYTRLTSVYTG
jgi:prepilin-type N-terminal cleavage/methylation domain-containing protein